MINPAQILQKANSCYSLFLRSFLTQENFFPLELSIGSLPKDYLVLRTELTQLIDNSKQNLCYGYNLELKSRKTHKHGQQSLPKRISIETEEDYLKLIQKEQEFIKFKADVDLIRVAVPELNWWLCQNPLEVIKHSDWHDLLKVCQYFQSNPKINLYIRELPIQVHTKFIEQNKDILRRLLEAILPIEQLISVEGERECVFEKRFSLRYREPTIRFRVLDRTIKARYSLPFFDISTPISEFRQLCLESHRFFITENLMNFLTFPGQNNGLAIFGGGYAIQALKSVTWLSQCPIFYWGDLDVDGFKILSQLRSHFPQTISIMMDIKTFETFQEFAVPDSSGGTVTLPHLTGEEQSLYAYLSLYGKRLEQEHISQDYANYYLQNLVQLI
ncbi:Wadjet anti-phage system protein JetD domain-containing protein [Aliterella atlantica]|uniref:Lipoprotein n=1 Tax=Aliterella atlantica CENA595 TaxID=1618023 RepID=A0A0D8ZP46_9CYAN|nr:Wadjet anti-phage system protein JetD domain-containing protein [Aliterella atlantica]KJH70593.1 lipoprotein [Aliterella atlantica CENA595]